MLFRSIPGIAIFNKGFPAQATAKKKSKPLNNFAPYWGDFDIEHYSKLRTMGHPTGYPIITGMGCVGNCTFCSSGMGGVRFRPVEEVIAEMKQVDKKYDIDMFFFATEIFFSKKSDVEKFCTMYKATGLNIPWHCQLRADFNNELIPLLADAGCRGVSIGVEAYDNAALKAMNKGITTKLIDATIGTAKKHGMDVLIGMMIGNIGDTRESVVKTVDFLIEAGCISFGLQTLLIYPGTKSYDLAIKNGLVEDEFAHCLKNSAPDVWDQILYDEYPNVSAIPKDEYRALYREQMIRINGYLLEKKAAKNIDFLNNNYTCRNCGKLDEYPMETNSMPTTRICDACAHYNYLNPVVQLMRNDRELLSSLQDLNDQGPSRVAVFCPQKQLTCSALQLFFHPYGNLTPVFMRDQIPENALEMEMTFDTMASFNGDRFSSALSFCVNCPHEMEQLAIERGIDAQNCLRATPEDLCTDFALNFEKRLFWYSVNHDIMCFGEKAAEFLTAKGLNRAAIVTDEGVAHAFASGWEKKGAVTS